MGGAGDHRWDDRKISGVVLGSVLAELHGSWNRKKKKKGLFDGDIRARGL